MRLESESARLGGVLTVLTVVPDLATESAWVQVLGRISINSDTEGKRLSDASQRLLAVLVAAGPDGASAERIAEEIWSEAQPNPWRPALRMAITRLRKQLPAGWSLVSNGGFYAIVVGSGCIDAWRLEEIANSDAQVNEHDLSWMLAGQPFPDVDLLELVAASTQRLQMQQITVAERFCKQPHAAIGSTCAQALTSLVAEHHYNDRLAMTVATTLAEADRQPESLLMLGTFAETYATEFGSVPADIADFIATGGVQDQPEATSGAALLQATADVPSELRALLETPLLGRKQEIDELVATGSAIVIGALGSGKTRLLAELVIADRSVVTTYIVGDDRVDLGLGPFAVALPSLRNDLVEAAELEPAAAATKAWPVVLDHLESSATLSPQRLIVDDAHLLDDASLALLRLLIRTTTSAAIDIVVSGRNDIEDSEWKALALDAERAGLKVVKLKGLEFGVLAEMAYGQFPQATVEARQGFAREVHEATGGLPLVAAALIAAADPETLMLSELPPGAPALSRVVSVSEPAREVAAAAAVLGLQFSVGALASLTAVDESVLFGVLEELWASGLVVETADPDQVRFRHVLIQRALLEGVPLFRRGQMHLRAADLTTDVHAKADHYANAGASIEPHKTARALCESARIFAERGMWRKACREFQRARVQSDDQLDVASLILFATALDRSGADGSEERRLAFDTAMADHDATSALDAALSGLPEAEAPDGDLDRIEMLESIDEHDLLPQRRFERVFHLSRQHGLRGWNAKALAYADEAFSLASNADEVALSQECKWMGARHSDRRRTLIPSEILHGGGLPSRTRLAHINAINIVESGDFARGRDEFARFKELAYSSGDPHRIWQSMGNDVMFLIDDAEFSAAEQAARVALNFGAAHDLQSAAALMVGQRLHIAWLQERSHEVDLEPFRSNLSTTLMGRAGLVLQASELGASNVGDAVRSVVGEALDRDGTFALLAMIWLTPLLAEHAPDNLVAVRNTLGAYGTDPLLMSFGAASFGPTSRYVAYLTDSVDEKRELIAQSIRAADQQGQLVWRIHARLDASDSGDAASADQARLLAKGTELEATVEHRLDYP